MLAHDPIVAVSSPPGRSHRGIIRASGDSLRPVLGALFDPPPQPRRLVPCRFRLDPHVPGESRTLPLPCLALFHAAPRSFTAQDVIEIQVPGNPALLDRAMHTLLRVLRQRLGAGRIAEPGEFTRRAFTAGRIDLTAAEGIAATIGAVGDAQLEAARLLRTGRLGSWAVRLVDRLGQLLALVEAGIDFIDQDDVTAITPADLDDGLAEVEGELRGLLDHSRPWSAIEALPWVVLLGPPNAGKSTLFNALLGRRRAVTSDIAGTTRDVLTEPLRLPPVTGDRPAAEVMLADIAGLDQPETLLDRAMQEAARNAIERAELILRLHSDGTPPPDGPIHKSNAPALRIHPKADLIPPDRRWPDADALYVSALTGEGLDELRRRIAAALGGCTVSLAGQMLALQPRHHDELRGALGALAEARGMLGPQRSRRTLADMELVAERLRAALDHLGALGGHMTPDDVIGKVFATFCIGK